MSAPPAGAPLDRPAVLLALQDELAARLGAVEQVAAMARDEASNSETKQEGKYDTRSTEASYLARGQAWRIAELRELLLWARTFDPQSPLGDPPHAQLGALVSLAGPGRSLLFLAPVGGPKLVVGDSTVAVVSLRSPLGAAVAGLEEGDEVDVEVPTGLSRYEVLRVW